MTRLTKAEKLPIRVLEIKEYLDDGYYLLSDLIAQHGPEAKLRITSYLYEGSYLELIIERDETPEEYSTRMDHLLAEKKERSRKNKMMDDLMNRRIAELIPDFFIGKEWQCRDTS